MGCVTLGERNCVHLPSVGEQTANQLPNFTQPMGSNNSWPSTGDQISQHFLDVINDVPMMLAVLRTCRGKFSHKGKTSV